MKFVHNHAITIATIAGMGIAMLAAAAQQLMMLK
jgi:hypothetical protein